jgi:predicted Zn-dependent peptidase
MRAAIVPFAALIFAAGAYAQGGAIPRHPRDLKYEPLSYTAPKPADFRHKLSNGATAFLVEDHDFPLITVNVIVRTGDFADPAGKTGLAGLTGSLMRSGGTKSKPPAVFDEEVAFLAAQLNSTIQDFNGAATLNCLSKDTAAGLALLVDMLRNPGFAEDRIKLVKNQILQSMERRNDNPPDIEQREFRRLVRGAQHFSALLPTKASIESITREDLSAFHEKYYYPGNFVFAVSGDFKTAEFLATLEKALAGWPNRTEALPPVPKPGYTPQPGLYVVDKKGVNQGRVRMGHLGVTIDNPDHIALSVMNGILGGSAFTSRITSRVRSDEGLAYQAASIFQHGTYYEGVFAAVFQSKSPSVAQAITIVNEEIAKLQNSKVTAEELATEVNSLIDSFPRRFSTAGLKAGQFANDFYYKQPDDYWQKYRDRVRAVTADEIQRVAKKYLAVDKMAILAVGDLDAMAKGNPDKPEFSLAKLSGPKGIVKIALPDPLTMVYPAP